MAFFNDSQNPFADPSVRNATQSSQPATIDFNPFENPAPAPKPTIAPLPPPPSSPAVSAPKESTTSTWPFQPDVGSSVMREEAPPPSYATIAAQKVNSEELDRRQRELDAKAAELQRREEAIRLAASGTINNWPPLPACCPVKPCYYQDFDVEIPDAFRSLVRIAYFITLAHLLVYFCNMILSFSYFMVAVTSQCPSTDPTCTSAGTTFGMSLLWSVLFAPASYACWFRPVYRAFKSDSSFSFFWFFFVSLGQFIVDIVWTLGFLGSGSIGFINGLNMMQHNTGLSITMVIFACFWALLAAADALLVVRVHRVYRSTGASFEKAKAELARGAFSSDVMREAVVAGAQSALVGNSASSSGSNPKRF